MCSSLFDKRITCRNFLAKREQFISWWKTTAHPIAYKQVISDRLLENGRSKPGKVGRLKMA